MVGAIVLSIDSGLGSHKHHEKLHPLSLCFVREELEKQYRAYQSALARISLGGKRGALALTSISFCINCVFFYIQQIARYIQVEGAENSGAVERIISGIPLTLFVMYHHFIMNMGGTSWDNNAAYHRYVIQLTFLYAITETLIAYANESFPEYEGCLANRFRCPNTFTGPKFASRGAAFSAIIIFHLTPCMSFLGVVQLVVIIGTLSRAFGLAFYRTNLFVSVWSSICMCLQVCIFLGFRYKQELHDRRRFLLQLHITSLRSNLVELLDCMVPRTISHRIQEGKVFIDPYRNVPVLLCFFPLDASPQANLLESYLLLDEVHQAFDSLLQQAGSNTFKVDCIGTDYMVTHAILSTTIDRGTDLDEAEAAQCAFCNHLACFAGKMRATAQHILAGSGLDLRFAVYTGPVAASIIGASRRHLRIIGDAVDIARNLCDLAEPWQVLSAGRAAESIRGGGIPTRSVGRKRLGAVGNVLVFEVDCVAVVPPLTSAPKHRPCEHRSLKNLAELQEADCETFPLQEALADLSEAVGMLSSGADAALADASQESRFLLESGGRSGGGLESLCGMALRTACVAVCQLVFLRGLPGFDGEDGELGERAGRLRMWMAIASLAGAVLPAVVAPELAGQGGQWAAMHACFYGGCVALAHLRAEPFLFLGFSMGASMWFIAPPFSSVAVARWTIGFGYAAFLVVFAASSWRDGLSQPTAVLLVPSGLLVYLVPDWLRKEGQAARVLWLLDGQRRRERAALWAVLRDMLPEYVLEGLGRGAKIDPHVKQAVVLHVDLQGTMDSSACAWRGKDGGSDGVVHAARAAESQAMVESLHELLKLFDREVRQADRC